MPKIHLENVPFLNLLQVCLNTLHNYLDPYKVLQELNVSRHQYFLKCLFFLVIVFLAGLGLLVSAYYGFDHVQSRIDRFLNPEAGSTYQVDKSMESFRNGGVFGTGPGQGSVKLNLPDAHADFIFAVSGEELGFVLTVILAGLFLFILLRGFNHLMESEDMISFYDQQLWP